MSDWSMNAVAAAKGRRGMSKSKLPSVMGFSGTLLAAAAACGSCSSQEGPSDGLGPDLSGACVGFSSFIGLSGCGPGGESGAPPPRASPCETFCADPDIAKCFNQTEVCLDGCAQLEAAHPECKAELVASLTCSALKLKIGCSDGGGYLDSNMCPDEVSSYEACVAASGSADSGVDGAGPLDGAHGE